MAAKEGKYYLICNYDKYDDISNYRLDLTVTAFTNEMAMEQFALDFAPDVTVLEPQRLREKVKSALEKALEKYN